MAKRVIKATGKKDSIKISVSVNLELGSGWTRTQQKEQYERVKNTVHTFLRMLGYNESDIKIK